MPVRHKPGSKPYRDQLRASLSAMGAQGPRLTELVARDLQLHGTRPRQAWRYAAELSQREAAERFNQLTGNPRAPMTGNRIGDYEQWPDGGVRPTVATLKILADAYGTTWDQLVDARDLAQMPESDRLEYLEISRVPARPPGRGQPASTSRGRADAGTRDDVIADVADESLEFGEWAGMSEVADATIEQYEAQARSLARDFDFGAPFCRCCWRPGGCGTGSPPGCAATRGWIRPGTCTCSPPRCAGCSPGRPATWATTGPPIRTPGRRGCAPSRPGTTAPAPGSAPPRPSSPTGTAGYTESAQLAEDGLGYAPPIPPGCSWPCSAPGPWPAPASGKPPARPSPELIPNDPGRAPRTCSAGSGSMAPVRYHGLAASTLLLLDEPGRVLTEAAEVIALSRSGPARRARTCTPGCMRTSTPRRRTCSSATWTAR